MTWLSEDPWPLGVVLGVIALGCLIALKVTQQGKFLLGAVVAVVLALGLILVERVWVTDNERIEQVVYDLARAAERSDADAVLALLTPDFTLTQTGITLGGNQAKAIKRVLPKADLDAINPARAVVRASLRETTFDFLTISRLAAHAGKRTRMGRAEFRAFASGSIESGGVKFNFATDGGGTDWAAGLREVDGQWKIESLTAVRLPRGWQLPGSER